MGRVKDQAQWRVFGEDLDIGSSSVRKYIDKDGHSNNDIYSLFTIVYFCSF